MTVIELLYGLFLCLLEISRNLWFSDVFQEVQKETSAIKWVKDNLLKITNMSAEFFFLIGIHFMQGNSHYEASNYEKKKCRKIEAHRKFTQKKPAVKKWLLILDLKLYLDHRSKEIIPYRQITPEYSCARKETVDIDILVTSKNGKVKHIQSIRLTCKPPTKIIDSWVRCWVSWVERGLPRKPSY